MCMEKNHYLIIFSKDDNIKGNRNRLELCWSHGIMHSRHVYLRCLDMSRQGIQWFAHVVAHIGHIIKQAFSILFIKKVLFTWGYNRRKENDRTNYSSLVHGSYCGTLKVHYVAIKHLHFSQAFSTKYASVHIICMFHVDFNIWDSIIFKGVITSSL
jgi:hypothetical protein